MQWKRGMDVYLALMSPSFFLGVPEFPLIGCSVSYSPSNHFWSCSFKRPAGQPTAWATEVTWEHRLLPCGPCLIFWSSNWTLSDYYSFLSDSYKCLGSNAHTHTHIPYFISLQAVLFLWSNLTNKDHILLITKCITLNHKVLSGLSIMVPSHSYYEQRTHSYLQQP